MRCEFNDEEKENSWMIDVGRPSFFTDDVRQWWQRFFNFVETSNIRIQVNSVYDTMHDYAFNNGCYGGGGFSFCFWFLTKEDRKTFVNHINTELEARYQHDFKNLHFHHNKDETLSIIISKKYLEKAEELIQETKLEIKPYTHTDLCGKVIVYPFYEITGELKNIILLKKLLDEYSLEIK
jgi:hypothetical protein